MTKPNSNNCTIYLELAKLNNVTALQVPFFCVKYSFEFELFLMVVFTILVIGTAGGNMLVILSVGMVKKLQTPSNFLIVNLACSDFLVSILVLPGAIYQQIYRNRWPFSELLCNIFISFDVILCTSSILNLCAISIDRYLVITRPFQYAVNRTPGRMAIMIAISWLTSALISIPPLFGMKDEFISGQCGYSENLIYQIYATFGAFYIPLMVMLILYGRIFKLARDLAQNDAKMKIEISPNSTDQSTQPYAVTKGNYPQPKSPNGQLNTTVRSVSVGSFRKSRNVSESSQIKLNSKNRTKLKSSTETKAITTLGVIMGCFTICWLPFFIIQIAKPVLKVANVEFMNYFPIWLIEVCLWLGYFNSFLNPIIYAKFNREFRTPFKQILLCRCKSINARLRNEMFVQEYGLLNVTPSVKRPSFEQNLLNNGNLTKQRRRRIPGPSRHNPCLNNFHDKVASRFIYKCSKSQTPSNGIKDELDYHDSQTIDKLKINENEFENIQFNFYDQISPSCSMTDQRSEKYIYDFGPASESVNIDPPPFINISTFDLYDEF